jgi:hypothetical protein
VIVSAAVAVAAAAGVVAAIAIVYSNVHTTYDRYVKEITPCCVCTLVC